MARLSEITMPKPHLTGSFAQTQADLTLKLIILLASTLIVFWQDLSKTFTDALQNETTSYVLAVPFILIYLVYRKRKMLRAVMPLNANHQPRNTRNLASISGILLAVTAALLYWYGSYRSTPLEYHMFSLPLFMAGLILILFNPQTLRQLIFPIIFLWFLMPVPTSILNTAGSTLQTLTAQTSNALTKLFNIPSSLTTGNGNPLITLKLPDGTTQNYLIDTASSSIYTLIGFTVFAVTVAYIVRDKPWKKAALILIGIPLIYLLNIIRIAAMLIIGYNLGVAAATQTFNLLGGFILIFIGTLLLLLISTKAFKTQMLTKTPISCLQCNPKPQPDRDYCTGCGRIFHPATTKLHKTDLLKATAIILAAIRIAAIQAPVFAISQGALVIAVTTPTGQEYSTSIFPQVNDYTLTFLYENQLYETTAKQDLSLAYLYSSTNQSLKPVWLTLEVAQTQSRLRSWETSLTSGRTPQAIEIESKDVQLTQNPNITGTIFAFNYTTTGQTQVVLYWFTSTVLMINQTVQPRQVEISLIANPNSMNELPNVEQQLLSLATVIAGHWQPIQAWGTATLIISQNGLNLSFATTATLAAALIYYTAETRKRRKTNLNALSKLPNLSQKIVKAIQETKKPLTLETLTETLKTTTAQTITPEQLEQRITELENTGIIKNQIYNQNDTPIQTWQL